MIKDVCFNDPAAHFFETPGPAFIFSETKSLSRCSEMGFSVTLLLHLTWVMMENRVHFFHMFRAFGKTFTEDALNSVAKIASLLLARRLVANAKLYAGPLTVQRSRTVCTRLYDWGNRGQHQHPGSALH
jgi:hypothetical protein